MRTFIFLIFVFAVTAATIFGQTPTTADGWNALGAQQFTKKDYDGSIKAFTECIRLMSDAAGCYHNRSLAYWVTKHNDLAIADSYSWSKFSSQPVLNAYLNILQIYVEDRNWPKVISSANEAMKLFPPNPDFYYYRGVAYANTQQDANAIEDATRSIELKPSTHAYLLRSQIYCNQMDLKSAEADESNIRNMGGKVEKGCYASAESAAANIKAVPAAPNRPEAEKMVAAAEKLLGDAGAAMEKGNISDTEVAIILAFNDIDKAIAFDPQFAKAFQTRGILNGVKAMLPSNKTPDASRVSAMADFNKAIELDPKYERAYFGRAMIYEQMGDKAKAKADFQKALQLDPKDKDAEMGLKRVS